jgi:hypothetical protein
VPCRLVDSNVVGQLGILLAKNLLLRGKIFYQMFLATIVKIKYHKVSYVIRNNYLSFAALQVSRRVKGDGALRLANPTPSRAM